MKKIVSVFIMMTVLFGGQPYVTAEEPVQMPVFNQNFLYQFSTEFNYVGPESWYGVAQINHPETGEPLYPQIPHDSRAIYIKYLIQSEEDAKKHDYNPLVEVKIYQNTNDATSLSMLTHLMGAVEEEGIITQPKMQRIQGKTWFVGEFRFAWELKEKVLRLRRKIYTLQQGDFIMMFQLTSTEDQFAQDVSSFEASLDALEWGVA